jgi:hypothetical protein
LNKLRQHDVMRGVFLVARGCRTAGDTAATAMKSVVADPDRYGGLTRAGTRNAMQTLSGQPEDL